MSLLAPYLLFGLILAGAPILIHLLNRRRFIRVDWAPMEYLKLTLKANRRRLRLEQILLLVVRTLMVILLFLALARLVAQRDSLAGFLTARARTSRILVIDDSLSMGYKTAGQSSMERAKEAALGVVEATGAKDSLTVMSVSRPDEPLVRQAQLKENGGVGRLIESLDNTHLANDWKAIFDRVEEEIEASAFPMKEVVIVTDLRAEGWGGELADVTEGWAQEDVKVFIVDVGAKPEGNVVLESLGQVSPIALAGAKVNFLATVRNDGEETIAAPQATLNLDEDSRAITLPDLAAGQSVEVPLSLVFEKSGGHRVELVLPTDLLPGDNRRFVAVEVKEALHLLLVDGEPGRLPFTSETDFLALAFSVGSAPWRVSQVIDSEWLTSPLTAPDVLILANVAMLPADRVKQLEELVESGMGLMVFPGGQIDPPGWNELVFRHGQGLLPVGIGAVLDEEVEGLVLEPEAASLLGPLARLSAESMARVRPRRLTSVLEAEDSAGAVRVLARWNDAQNSPALLEKTFGAGRVMFWTVTADKGWSDWPTEPSYVLAMRQAVETLAANRDEGANLTAGQPLRHKVEAAGRATVRVPDTDQAVPVSWSGEAERALLYPVTSRAGFYEMKWEDASGGLKVRVFAVNPDARESRLEALPRERLESLMGKVDWRIIPFSGEGRILGGQGAELWRSFILGLIGLVALEPLLAAWVGRPK